MPIFTALLLDELAPPQVDLKHLNAKGRLLTEQEAQIAKQLLDASPSKRIGKKDTEFFPEKYRPYFQVYYREISLPYAVMRLNNQDYVIYEGLFKSRTLGSGNFGVVKLIQNINTGEWSAVKVINLIDDFSTKKAIEKHVQKEILPLKIFNLYMGDIVHERDPIYGESRILLYQAVQKSFIGIRYIRGIPLDKLIIQQLSLIHLLNIIFNLGQAVKNLHAKGWLHRDIKPDNIIYCPGSGKLKLIDFGLSIACQNNTLCVNDSYAVGTPGYAAPEIMKPATFYEYSEKTEIYALGQTIKKLIAERWQACSYLMYLKDNFIEEPCTDNNNNCEQVSLVKIPKKYMLAEDPHQRPTIKELMDFLGADIKPYLKILNQTKQIGLIQIKDLFSHKKKISKKLVKALQQVDQVWLIHNPQRGMVDENSDSIQAHQLAAHLQAYGLKVGGILELSTPEADLDSLASVVEAKKAVEKKVNGSSNTYCYFTSNTEFADTCISKAHDESISLIKIANDKKLALTAADEIPLFNTSIVFKKYDPIPNNVRLKHINLNGRLLTHEQIILVKEQFKQYKKRHRLKIDGLPFTTMFLNGRYYAVYKGGNSKLGSGAFGKVKLMQDLDSGEWCALKILSQQTLNGKLSKEVFIEELKREVTNLDAINAYKGALLRNKKFFDEKRPHVDKAFVAMNLAKGVPLSKLNVENLPLSRVLLIIENLLKAIQDLHAKRLLHRDITGKNILYDLGTDTASLVDVGLMVSLPEDTTIYSTDNICGTPKFMAPEVFCEHKYTEKTEIYAAGVAIRNFIEKNNIANALQKELPEVDFYLDNLVRLSEDNRPTFKEAIHYIETQRQNRYLVTLNKFKDIGFIRSDEIIDQTGKILPKIVKQLKSLDQVWLLTCPDNVPTASQKMPLSKIIRLLQKQGVNISGTLEADCTKEQFNSVDILVQAKKYIEKSLKADNINTFFLTNYDDYAVQRELYADQFYLTGETQPKAFVTQEHLDSVIQSLRKENARIQSRLNNIFHIFKDMPILKSRFDAVETMIKFLEIAHANGENQLTYDSLRDNLKALEQHIVDRHANKLRYVFKFFSSKQAVHGARAIAKIRNDLFHDDIVRLRLAPPCA